MKLQFDMKPYYFKALNTAEELKEIYSSNDNKTDEKFNVFNNDFSFLENHIGIDINDYESLFIGNDINIKKYIQYCNIIGFKLKVYDANCIFFDNKINLETLSDDIKRLTEEYIINNFDVNDVLDKINLGTELTYIDKTILKQF